ncbi:MAG: arginine repressor [Armatimonadota bacterium]|nr:arginine repressor [Armatimonadota bacterium]MDR5702990.1 arginine repressor [Armatimonadota bacterium]
MTPQERKRERLILEILRRQPVGTQAELVRQLRRMGMKVTQATVSRDLRRLGVVKVRTDQGGYRYLPLEEPLPPPREAQDRLVRSFQEFVTEVDFGVDLVLVKTLTGRANAVAAAIDEVRWPDVAGTVAGDDTIIVVPRTKAAQRKVLERLRKLLVKT